jgi:hypothetical protein
MCVCYRQPIATAAKQNASARMVVLLRPSEKLRIQRLARKERASSAEIMRRSLALYKEPFPEVDAKTLAEVKTALDQMLTRSEATLANLENHRLEMKKWRANRP